MPIKGLTVILAHDDWSLKTDRFKESELKIRTISFMPLQRNSKKLIIGEVRAADTSVLKFFQDIVKGNERVRSLKFLDMTRSGRDVRAIFLKEERMGGGIYEIMVDNGVYYLSESIYEGKEKWTLLVNERRVSRLLEELKENSYQLQVRRDETLLNTIISSKCKLTKRELEVLRIAENSGYFDWPRVADLEELSEKLGVSKTATLQTLRKALSKVVRSYLAEVG
jgi:predicted DNA binding protein